MWRSVEYLKSSPTVPGVSEILTPGERELRTETERRKVGIFVEDQSWDQIAEIAQEFKLAVPPAG